jgi:hypothetical protein
MICEVYERIGLVVDRDRDGPVGALGEADGAVIGAGGPRGSYFALCAIPNSNSVA